MPITPFHFGPGLLVKGLAPRAFSLTTFVAAQIVIDFESLYHLVRRDWPVHRTMHTLVGGTTVGIAVAVAILIVSRWTRLAPARSITRSGRSMSLFDAICPM